MVAINRQAETGTVKDIVCPKCFKPLQYPKVKFKCTDRYGRVTRACFGWCFECKLGFEVIQFAKEDRWFIHKYQVYTPFGPTCQPTGKWTVIDELPEPAAVVVGPGGDFDKQIDLAKINLDILATLHKTLKAVTQTVGRLLKALRVKHE